MRGEETSQASTSGRRITCPLPAWVQHFAEALEKIIGANTPQRARCGDGSSIYLSAWHTLNDPKIPMQSYIERLWRYSGCTAAAAYGSLTYIERLAASEDSFTPTAFNIHRLLTVTLVLGMKFFQEEVYPQDYLAMVGGMSGAELNLLELEVLSRLGFNAFVHEAQLQRAIDVVRANVAGGRAKVFPAARHLLETLWEDEPELLEGDMPSTPPAQVAAVPEAEATAAHAQPSTTARPVVQGTHLAKSAARRWSDSYLFMSGVEAEDDGMAVDGEHAACMGGVPTEPTKRMKVSVSESCFGLQQMHAMRTADSSMDGESLGFRSMDEDLMHHNNAHGMMAREALGALLCDEVFEDTLDHMALVTMGATHAHGANQTTMA